MVSFRVFYRPSQDPSRRRSNINCNSFQQDVIVSFNGWHYCCLYSFLKSPSSDTVEEPLYVHVTVLDDYEQTTDDGHNTVQMGIYPGDGTIHLSFDHHCDVLRYRCSVRGLATDPTAFEWTSSLFTPTLDYLPGLPSTHRHFEYVTYSRFGFVGDDMFCSFRDGKAGLSSDYLYLYSGATGRSVFAGAHLTGIRSNHDPLDTKHKQQAEPNAAENNHNICYAYSDDRGYTWKNGAGKMLTDLRKGETVDNDADGIVAFDIPGHSGLSNQEAQAVDREGGVQVLNRDTTDGGDGPVRKHYYRSPDGIWTKRPIRRVAGRARGRLAVGKFGDLFVMLPDFAASTMRIVKASKATGYTSYDEVRRGRNLAGEPLVDAARLEHDNVLSVLLLTEEKAIRNGAKSAVLRHVARGRLDEWIKQRL
ncbi:hypothetical protein N658DRAFT_569328 [Parathielavia hyrcaniae]|uniref:Uncharacterized protein n=1 Tax=Parathielavia hyrcaniae TaxID=113614 RepID=A0AAN6PTD3_9PEZI|nr:hypothetical protein N658DRAFT_569328 [Parathielavia hyrcaniae]